MSQESNKKENNRGNELLPQQPTQPNEVNRTKPLPNEDHIFNLQGNLKVVTTIPSRAPKSFADSIVVYVDSISSPTTKRLYIFSRETDSWYYTALT